MDTQMMQNCWVHCSRIRQQIQLRYWKYLGNADLLFVLPGIWIAFGGIWVFPVQIQLLAVYNCREGRWRAPSFCTASVVFFLYMSKCTWAFRWGNYMLLKLALCLNGNLLARPPLNCFWRILDLNWFYCVKRGRFFLGGAMRKAV